MAYTGFAILNRAIPFMLLPLLTRYLSPDAFGRISMFLAVQVLAMLVSGLCLNSVLMQRYFKMSQRQLRTFLLAAYGLMIVIGCVVSILLWLGKGVLEPLSGLSSGWLIMANACAVMSMAQAIGLALMQMRQQVVNFGLMQLLGTLSNLVLSILLVVKFHLGWQGRLDGIAASLLLTSMALLALQWRAGDLTRIGVGWDELRSATSTLVRLGLPLLPGGLVVWGMTMTDRFYLNSLASMQSVGIYAVGVMFAQVIEVLASAVGQSFMPIIYSRLNGTEEQRRKLVGWSYGVIGCYLGMAISWGIVGSFLIHAMLNARYHQAASVLAALSLGYALNNGASLMATFILHREKNHLVSMVSIGPFSISVLMNLALIPKLGILGAALAFVGSATANFIIMFVIACRTDTLPWFTFLSTVEKH
ncbi:oligosaccharide flippase family protein [Paludibacterium yongneupense]|uniref:oligosaccharide flippase family protein n=1 Tax=Paludibacterium yongneupense TaxID=400061 RepID=UPI00049200B9|nr:oligosaccharide flippase family protein [Paludibacterium yongneupense]